MAVVGFDDHDEIAAVDRGAAADDRAPGRVEEWVARAVEMLSDRICGTGGEQRVMLPTRLVVRSSA